MRTAATRTAAQAFNAICLLKTDIIGGHPASFLLFVENCCDVCINLFFPSQAESELYGIRLAEQSERLQEAERRSEESGQRVEELQRLLARMEVESSVLKDKMVADEAELLQLRAGGQKAGGGERR